MSKDSRALLQERLQDASKAGWHPAHNSNILDEATDPSTSVRRLRTLLEYNNLWEVQERVIINPSFPLKEAMKAARRNNEMLRALVKREDLPAEVFNNIICKTNDLSFSLKNIENDKLSANTLTTLVKRYKLNGEAGKYNHQEVVAFLLRNIVSHKSADAMTLSTVAKKIKTPTPSSSNLEILRRIVLNPKASGETLIHCFSKEGVEISWLRKNQANKKKICSYLEHKDYGKNLKDLPWEWIITLMEEAL